MLRQGNHKHNYSFHGFAKIYTPIVFVLALAVCFVPYFFVDPYILMNGFTVTGIPGDQLSLRVSRFDTVRLFRGHRFGLPECILFKGGNFLDVMTKVNAVVKDKTGTLTKGF